MSQCFVNCDHYQHRHQIQGSLASLPQCDRACWLSRSLADDHQALIWDIQQMPRAIEDPILAYTAEGEINNVQWASTQPDWIAICYNNCLEILRV